MTWRTNAGHRRTACYGEHMPASTTAAPLSPTALLVPDPVLVMAGSSDREGYEAHDDYAWLVVLADRREMSGGDGIGCREHGPRRPFLGYRTTETCTA